MQSAGKLTILPLRKFNILSTHYYIIRQIYIHIQIYIQILYIIRQKLQEKD